MLSKRQFEGKHLAIINVNMLKMIKNSQEPYHKTSTWDLFNPPEVMTEVIAVSPCMVFAHKSFIGVLSYPYKDSD